MSGQSKKARKMKARIFTIIAITWAIVSESAMAQRWIGESFTLDTSVVISYASLPSDMMHLQYCIQDSTLFFTEQKAFQHADKGYAAHIYAFSLRDYTTFGFDLPLPPCDQQKERMASTFWINDFRLYEDRCVISVQDHIILYHRNTPNTFEYDTIIDHPNVRAVYIYQDNLYYLEEDHDTGYKWFRFNRRTGKGEQIQELPYEAPHVVQASPNRYLFHDENNLFYLSTRYPILKKYRLDGTWLQDIRFDLPFWHPFEDEYIRQSLREPYGVERIYATKDQIFQYSYLKSVFPFENRYLVFYTQYDTSSRKSATMFALTDSTGTATLHTRRCPGDYKFSEQQFPFNLYQPLEDYARISWHNCLIEITADSDTPWRGLTSDEYQKLKEEFFRKHEPIIKIRIMRFKNRDDASVAFFYDSNRELKSLESLSEGKHLFIIHNELECSGCSHFLMQSMNSLDSEQVNLGILHAYLPGALQEREIIREVRQYLARPYDLYYLATDRTSQYPGFITQAASRFPAVMFYETGKVPILFSNDEIFDSDPYSFHFSEQFQNQLERFVAK